MGLFPDKKNFRASNDDLNKLIAGFDPTTEMPTLVDLLTSAHEVIKILAKGDMQKASDEANELLTSIGELDLTLTEVRVSLSALIMAAATHIPPSIYGGSNDI